MVRLFPPHTKKSYRLRLAFPRRMYTQSTFDYAAEAIAEVKERAASIRGVRIVKQPKFLRHFTAEFTWVD